MTTPPVDKISLRHLFIHWFLSFAMGKESVVEIPAGSGNKYRYVYDQGSTKYLGPVGSAPEIAEAEFMDAMSESISMDDVLWQASEPLMMHDVDRFVMLNFPVKYTDIDLEATESYRIVLYEKNGKWIVDFLHNAEESDYYTDEFDTKREAEAKFNKEVAWAVKIVEE